MFAASARSRVFHRIAQNDDRTVCGLSVGRFESSQPQGNSIHLIRKVPANYSECKHCVRIAVAVRADSYNTQHLAFAAGVTKIS
jgi:hypothetical protein